jgi:hypothetical protein
VESDENENIISEEDDAAFIPPFHINDLQMKEFWESRLEYRNDISKEGADPCLLAYQIQAAVDVTTPDFALSPQDRLIVEEAVLQHLRFAFSTTWLNTKSPDAMYILRYHRHHLPELAEYITAGIHHGVQLLTPL